MKVKRRELIKLGAAHAIAGQLIVSKASAQTFDTRKKTTPSVLQGATDESSTQFSIVYDANVKLKIVAIDTKKNVILPDTGKVTNFGSHPSSITKAFFSELDPNETYNLMIYDSKTDALLDQRLFKTLLQKDKNALKFALVSCMKETRHDGKLWQDLFANSPDVIFFIGDSVYADSASNEDPMLKEAATPQKLWTKFVEARMILDAYFNQKLIPIFAVWDDHDFGLNNATSDYPYVKQSQENFMSFFAQDESHCSYLQRGPGVGSAVKFGSQLFFLLDDRSYRQPKGSTDRYAHWGQEQEEWMMALIQKHDGPSWIMNGSQIFPSMMFKECVSKDHKNQFAGLLAKLKETKKKVAFASGDVHYSEISELEADFLGFLTYEITSSGFHSAHIPGAPGIIPNRRRIASTGKANYIIVNSTTSNGDLLLKVSCHSAGGKINFVKDLKV